MPTRKDDAEMGTVKESVCACAACVGACTVSPCTPTLADAARLILEGYGPRLMLARVGAVSLLLPSVKGFEGKTAPPQRWIVFLLLAGRGRCSFLTTNGMCELHAPGLKPLEGRLASHVPTSDSTANAIMASIVGTWDGPEGRALCEAWERSAGFSRGRNGRQAVVDAARRGGASDM